MLFILFFCNFIPPRPGALTVIDDRRRSRSREDPRRHTLGTEMLHYPNAQQMPMQRSMDLEVTVTATTASPYAVYV